MTAVCNTLEDTMIKQEVGYGAINDTTNPETTKTPTRTTYGILLFVISVFLVVGAGAAGVTRSSLRHDTASIVVSSERDSDDFVGADCNSCSYLSPDLKKAADLAVEKRDAAAIVATKAAAKAVAAKAAAVVAGYTTAAENAADTARYLSGKAQIALATASGLAGVAVAELAAANEDHCCAMIEYYCC